MSGFSPCSCGGPVANRPLTLARCSKCLGLSSSYRYIDLRKVVAFKWKRRMIGLGAGLGQAVSEIESSWMPSFAKASKQATARDPIPLSIATIDKFASSRKLSNKAFACEGAISSLDTSTIHASNSTIGKVNRRSAAASRCESSVPSDSPQMMATLAEASTITVSKSRRFRPCDRHDTLGRRVDAPFRLNAQVGRAAKSPRAHVSARSPTP